MFESISQSISLAKESWNVLMKDKELLVFPVMSGILSLVVLASFAGAFFVFGYAGSETDFSGPLSWVLVFLFYFVTYFFVIFFNTALVGAALMRLEGKDPTLGDGLSIAFSKLPGIIAWALVSATVGLILKSLERGGRRNILAGIASMILGVTWTLATFFVIPIMIAENRGPFDSVRRSVEIVKNKWGTAIAGRVGIGLVFGIMMIVVGLVFFGLIMLVPSLAVIWFLLGLFLIVMIAVVSSALSGVFVASMYNYATKGTASLGFEQSSLQGAVK